MGKFRIGTIGCRHKAGHIDAIKTSKQNNPPFMVTGSGLIIRNDARA